MATQATDQTTGAEELPEARHAGRGVRGKYYEAVTGRALPEAVRRGERPPTSPGTPLSVRLEADTLRRLRVLAAKKGTKYQTLLKQFVVERLYEEEKREGLVAAAAG